MLSLELQHYIHTASLLLQPNAMSSYNYVQAARYAPKDCYRSMTSRVIPLLQGRYRFYTPASFTTLLAALTVLSPDGLLFPLLPSTVNPLLLRLPPPLSSSAPELSFLWNVKNELSL